MMKDHMDILICCNDRIAKYVPVLLNSISMNHKRVSIDVYLMYFKEHPISDHNIHEISTFATAIGQHLHPICVAKEDYTFFMDHNHPHIQEHERSDGVFPLESCILLLAHEYLPKHVRRILYLDIDVIVNDNILDFYTLDFNDKLLSAVVYAKDMLKDKHRNEFDLAKAKGGRLFNTGVMMLNTERFRSENINKAFYMTHMQEANEAYPAIPFERTAQGILNYCACDKALFICEPMLNYKVANLEKRLAFEYLSDKDIPTMRIIHFAGMDKGWDVYYGELPVNKVYIGKNIIYSEAAKRMYDSFWLYARETPWYDEIKKNAIINTHIVNRRRIVEITSAPRASASSKKDTQINNSRIKRLKKELNELKFKYENSLSWRITAPLRYCKSLFVKK